MNLGQKLQKKAEELQSIQLAQNHFDRLSLRLSEEYRRLEEMNYLLEKKYQDIRSLENLSLRSLFRKVLGDQEEQLEMERQEYLQFVLKYKDLKKSIDLLEFELKILKEKVPRYQSVKKEFEYLFRLREAEVVLKDAERKNRIAQCNNRLDDRYQRNREVYEARIIGNKAIAVAKRIIDLLEDASALRNWSSARQIYDYDTEKGLIDQAVDHHYELKIKLQELEDHLRDVYKKQNLQLMLELDRFQNFSQAYFNNLIIDWIVQNRIHNTLAMMNSLCDDLVRIVYSLDREEAKILEQIKQISEEKRAIVLEEA
jgi:hypothetical protein